MPRLTVLYRADKKRYVLKSLFEPDYNYSLSLQPKLSESPYLRAVRDTIPGERMFVNEYLSDHLMNFAWKPLPLLTQKRILRDALRGLAAMHAQDIAHLDIKANNIMVDYHETDKGVIVDRVQLSDLEDATHIPPEQALRGMQVGNHWWRSPEAHVKGAINKPTDIFSFAIVVSILLIKLYAAQPANMCLVHLPAAPTCHLLDGPPAGKRPKLRHPGEADLALCRVGRL